MRNWTIAIAPLALAMTAAGCSGKDSAAADRNGTDGAPTAAPADTSPAGTRDFALTGFAGVEVAGPDDVNIRRGDAFSIQARGPQAELDTLDVRVDGQTLYIGRKREGFSLGGRHKGVEFTITLPALRAVKLTGSGSIEADRVDGDKVDAAVTGSGDLKIGTLTAKAVDMRVSGSGDIEIDGGSVDNADIGVTGSGDVDADGLTINAVDISITGSGSVDARATGKADIGIMGSGDVTLTGGATCSTRKVGSGTVTCQ